MTIRKFFVLSIIVHLLVVSGIYFIPVEQKKKPKEFFTKLVSPEEIKKPEIKQPEQKIKPHPPLPPMRKIKPVPLPPKARKAPPLPRYVPQLQRPKPYFPEKPVVPGEGREAGKPLPEDVYPKAGKGGETGEKSGTGRLSKPGYSDREKLFDEGIIGDVAKRDSGKGAKNDGDNGSKRDNSVTFDTSEYRYAGYMRKLKEKIESIWIYPPEARVKGIYGDLYIRFTIKKDGNLGAVELLRTSGYKMLDDAALKALKDGESYWPLPPEWGMESYSITGHFIYSLYGYYIR